MKDKRGFEVALGGNELRVATVLASSYSVVASQLVASKIAMSSQPKCRQTQEHNNVQ